MTSTLNTSPERVLDQAMFAGLAVDPGGKASLRGLSLIVDAQRSRNLLLLHMMSKSSNIDSFNLISLCRTTNRTAFNRFLIHPHVSRWLSQWAIAHRMGVGVADDRCTIDTFACALAVACDVEFSLDVPQSRDALFPGLGRLIYGNPSADFLRVSWDGSELRIEDNGHVILNTADIQTSTGTWLAMSKLVLSNVCDYVVDFDCLGSVQPRGDIIPVEDLTQRALADWQHRLSEGFTYLEQHHFEWASEVEIVVRVLAPLERIGVHTQSVTFADTFGFIGCTKPESPLLMAEVLVHELQHNKLNGILLVVALTNGSNNTKVYAPWRDDARPIEGLIHGIYAFFGVAHFWNVERLIATTIEHRSEAELKFARWRLALAKALRTALGCNELTEAGVFLLSSIDKVVEAWLALEVSPEQVRRAYQIETAQEIQWRLRNLSPFEVDVRVLAERYDAGEAAFVDSFQPSETIHDRPRSLDSAELQSWIDATCTYVDGIDGRAAEVTVRWCYVLPDLDGELSRSGRPASRLQLLSWLSGSDQK